MNKSPPWQFDRGEIRTLISCFQREHSKHSLISLHNYTIIWLNDNKWFFFTIWSGHVKYWRIKKNARNKEEKLIGKDPQFFFLLHHQQKQINKMAGEKKIYEKLAVKRREIQEKLFFYSSFLSLLLSRTKCDFIREVIFFYEWRWQLHTKLIVRNVFLFCLSIVFPIFRRYISIFHHILSKCLWVFCGGGVLFCFFIRHFWEK